MNGLIWSSMNLPSILYIMLLMYTLIMYIIASIIFYSSMNAHKLAQDIYARKHIFFGGSCYTLLRTKNTLKTCWCLFSFVFALMSRHCTYCSNKYTLLEMSVNLLLTTFVHTIYKSTKYSSAYQVAATLLSSPFSLICPSSRLQN